MSACLYADIRIQVDEGRNGNYIVSVCKRPNCYRNYNIACRDGSLQVPVLTGGGRHRAVGVVCKSFYKLQE